MIWLFCEKLEYKRLALTDEEIISANHNKELYSSMYYYSSDMSKHLEETGSVRDFNGEVFGHYFIVDFDSPEGTAPVAAAMVPMLDKLTDLDIPYYLFLSGKKGYHFYLHKQFVEYDEALDNRWNFANRSFGLALIEEFPELTPYWDNQMYDAVRMFRFPYSIHPGTGKQKQLFEYYKDEFLADTAEDYFLPSNESEIDIISRIFLGPTRPHDNDEIFLSIKGIRTEPTNKAVMPEVDIEFPMPDKSCIKAMLQEIDIQGSRHQFALHIQSWLRNNATSSLTEGFGLPKEIGIPLMRKWNARLKEPLPDNELDKLLESYDRYSYGCNDKLYMKYCSEACPLYKDKDDVVENVTTPRQHADNTLTTEGNSAILSPGAMTTVTTDDNRVVVSRGLSLDLRDWVSQADGAFNTNDVYRDLHLTSRGARKKCVVVLGRLAKEGIIERFGEKRGYFRTVEADAPVIDWKNTTAEILNMRFPFELERLANISPGNIVIVAGEPNSGKTAFMLNVVALNMDDYEVVYFSSEMGANEFALRCSKFQDIDRDDWNFTAIERSSNFADVIKPDALNIVDYLEVHEDFWRVGAHIKAIFDKLKNGVAVIALQKNISNGRTVHKLGRGGLATIEKARLAVSLEPGKIEIVKAKNWAVSHINPNGLRKHFEIRGGSEFIISENWSYKDREDHAA